MRQWIGLQEIPLRELLFKMDKDVVVARVTPSGPRNYLNMLLRSEAGTLQIV